MDSKPFIHGCVVCGRDVKWWQRQSRPKWALFSVHSKCLSRGEVVYGTSKK